MNFLKNLLITLLMLTAGFATYAKPLNKDTNYITDPTLQRYEGTWEFKNDKITFRIVLETGKRYIDIYHKYFEDISGYHLYIKDNKTIQSSIGKQKTLRYGTYWGKDILMLTFTDLERPISYHALVEMLPDGRLKWKLKNREGIRFINNQTHQLDDKGRDDSFHVPNNLILTKVK